MHTNSSMPSVETQVVDPAVKRRRVELALDNFLAGQAGDSDYVVFRDHRHMKTATASQACKFIAAVPGRTIPIDILYIWAAILRSRYLQSMSGRRSGGSGLPQTLVEVPAYPLGEEEDEA